MSWLKKLGQYAPDIAAAIATGGTSVIASTALRIAAKEITGDEDISPQGLKQAVESASPEQMIALTKANNDFTVGLEQIDLDRLRAVNETMQAESQSEHWYQAAWRPYWGFITATAFGIIALCIAVMLAVLAWKQPDKIIVNLPMIIGSITTLFGIPGAILGVTAWHRGQEKRIKAGEEKAGT